MRRRAQTGLTGVQTLGLFPEFMQVHLAEDPQFRADLGITLGGTIYLGPERIAFDQAIYLAAIRRLHAEGGAVEVCDNGGRSWTFTAKTEAGETLLSLKHADQTRLLPDLVGLKADAAGREADFDRALDSAGLVREALPAWRQRLRAAPLDDDDVQELSLALKATPKAFASRLRDLEGRQLNVEDLVPSDRGFFDHLAGAGAAANVEALGRAITDAYVAALLARDELEGAKSALLLGTHSTLVSPGPLKDLSDATLLALADWLVHHGDLISRVAFIELALPALQRLPALEPFLVRLVEDLLAQDPTVPGGPFSLLSAMFVLADGQVSAARTLADLPPFHRRHLTLALAALIERCWGRARSATELVEWILDNRGAEFYLQTLVDMRTEPRWQVEYATAPYLKSELLSRINAAVRALTPELSAGPLHERLLGQGPDALPAQLSFPDAFLPGPLEGAVNATPAAMPKFFETELDALLEAETLSVKGVAALINLAGVFQIPPAKVDRAVTLIRERGHRLPIDADPAAITGLLSGLADVAATTRNGDLADELRLMARRRRYEAPDLTAALTAEFNIAMSAAAAHIDFGAWRAFVGAWLGEIAFAVRDKQQAAVLILRLELLCLKAPGLRDTLGRSIVALNSLTRSP